MPEFFEGFMSPDICRYMSLVKMAISYQIISNRAMRQLKILFYIHE